jgi:vacuolar-type H+-ATPase subunit H
MTTINATGVPALSPPLRQAPIRAAASPAERQMTQRNNGREDASIFISNRLFYRLFEYTPGVIRRMDDTLQRLLDAEMRAEKIAQQAEAERENVLQRALMEARAEEERFTSRIPDLHRAFIRKAEERADQTVAELKRRYDERHLLLRDTAEQREEEALDAAFELLIRSEL